MKNKENKIEKIVKNNKQKLIFGIALFILTLLLCIPQTLFVLVGIFGWVIFAYYGLLLALFFTNLINKKIYIKTKYLIFLILGIISLISTLHIATTSNENLSNFTKYIVNAYTEHNTVGGIIFSILTCVLAVPINSVWGIVIFVILTALFLFLFIKPIVLENKSVIDEKYREKHKLEEKKYREVLLDDSPFLKNDLTEEKQRVLLSDSYMEKTKANITKEEDNDEYKSKIKINHELYSTIFGSEISDINKKNEEKERQSEAERKQYAEEFFFGHKEEQKIEKEPEELKIEFDEVEEDYKIFEEEKNENIIDLIYSKANINEANKDIKLDETDINSDNYEQRKEIWEKLSSSSSISVNNQHTDIENIEDNNQNNNIPKISVDYNDINGNDKDYSQNNNLENLYEESEDDFDEIEEVDDFDSALSPISNLIDTMRTEKTSNIEEQKSNIDEEEKDKKEEIYQEDEEQENEIINNNKFNNDEIEEEFIEEENEDFNKTTIEEQPKLESKPVEKQIENNINIEQDKEQKPLDILKNEEDEDIVIHDVLKTQWDPSQKQYLRPPITILQDHINPRYTPYIENMDNIKEILEERAQKLGIKCKVVEMTKGPTVTTVKLDLDFDCSIRSLENKTVDLQRYFMCPKPPNVISNIPGTRYCALEIPNNEIAMVSFKEIFLSKEYINKEGELVCVVGKTAQGDVYTEDIEGMPHALIAGATGMGKSVTMNDLLMSLIMRYSPDEVKLILIDLKLVEMEPYAGLPHMIFRDALSNEEEILNALRWALWEVNRRYNLIRSKKLHKISEYNEVVPKEEKLCRIVVVIDEASELMQNKRYGKDYESVLCSLARIARAAGVHLLFATQNPVKKVITGDIQNNLNTKIALGVADVSASMIVLKEKGAETLFCKGDMIVKRGAQKTRVQAAYVDAKEINDAVEYIKQNNKWTFDEYMINKIVSGEFLKQIEEEKENKNKPQNREVAGSGVADLVKEEDNSNKPSAEMIALRTIVENDGYISASFLQRKLKKGFNGVMNILDALASKGYITSVSNGSNEKRKLLISKDDFCKMWNEMYGETDPINID